MARMRKRGVIFKIHVARRRSCRMEFYFIDARSPGSRLPSVPHGPVINVKCKRALRCVQETAARMTRYNFSRETASPNAIEF